MKESIFEEILVAATNFHLCSVTIHHWIECYNVTGEPNEDGPLNINIPKSKGCAQSKDLEFLETNYQVNL